MSDVRLFLCGDVMLGRGIDQILRHPSQPRLYEPHAESAMDYVHLAEERLTGRIPRHVGPAYVWGDALAILDDRKPDIRIVNPETAITKNGGPCPKGINYRMHPDNVGCLTAARVDCCCIEQQSCARLGTGWVAGDAGYAESIQNFHRRCR